MPATLRWHDTCPILFQTLVGELSGDELQEMCDRRQEILDAATRPVILLADAQELESVSEAATSTALCENVVLHKAVYRTLIVLKPGLFRSLRSAIEAMEPHDLPVQFFSDPKIALIHAEELCQSLS